jgi:hypothetical protein
MPARTGYYQPPQGLLSDQPTKYFDQYGLNYDPNYQPITGTLNFSYTDAMNQGYSPAMSEAAARGQGIPQYAPAAAPGIEDAANLARREQQGNGMGLFAGGVAGILGAAGLINAFGGAAAAGGGSAGTAGTGTAAGTGATAGTAGSAGTAAGTAGAVGAPAGIEGVTVVGSSGAGAGGAAGAGAGIGGTASFWDSVNQGASDTSATNAQNEQELQNMQAPSTGTDWQSWIKRANQARGLLSGGDEQQPMMGGAMPGLLGGGASAAHGVANQRSVVRRSPLENYMALNRLRTR